MYQQELYRCRRTFESPEWSTSWLTSECSFELYCITSWCWGVASNNLFLKVEFERLSRWEAMFWEVIGKQTDDVRWSLEIRSTGIIAQNACAFLSHLIASLLTAALRIHTVEPQLCDISATLLIFWVDSCCRLTSKRTDLPSRMLATWGLILFVHIDDVTPRFAQKCSTKRADHAWYLI